MDVDAKRPGRGKGIRLNADKEERGGQKLAKSCGRPLLIAPMQYAAVFCQ